MSWFAHFHAFCQSFHCLKCPLSKCSSAVHVPQRGKAGLWPTESRHVSAKLSSGVTQSTVGHECDGHESTVYSVRCFG